MKRLDNCLRLLPGTVFARTFCLLSLTFIITVGCEKSDTGDQYARVMKAINQVKVQLDQQTAVLHRAMGKQIPIEMPPEIDKELKRFESLLANQSQWPKSGQNANILYEELQELMKKIPPWAEEELLPRLNCIRWGVMALKTLKNDEEAPPEDYDSIASNYRILLEDA